MTPSDDFEAEPLRRQTPGFDRRNKASSCSPVVQVVVVVVEPGGGGGAGGEGAGVSVCLWEGGGRGIRETAYTSRQHV